MYKRQVEQNAKVALETADYGYVLEVGRVVMHDTSEALMNTNEIQQSYLGVHADDTRAKSRRERARAVR